MPEFTQSWAFWFIIGCFAVAVIVFILWIICAASGKGSRMEERMSDTMFKTVKRGKATFSKMAHETKIATQNNPRTD